MLRAQRCRDLALYVRPAIYQQSVEGPKHQCGYVLGAQRCPDLALYVRPAIYQQSVEGPKHQCGYVLGAQRCPDLALYVRPAIYQQSVEGPKHQCGYVLWAQRCLYRPSAQVIFILRRSVFSLRWDDHKILLTLALREIFTQIVLYIILKFFNVYVCGYM